MGLDMYLSRRTYVQRWDHIPPEDQFRVTVERGGKPYPGINSDKISYVIEQVAYWRKANQIHKWFVDNVQEGNDNCGDWEVGRDQLADLLKLCRVILNAPTPEARRSLAQELLPPQEGFFFGNTDIDEWYFSDIEVTVKQIAPLLEEGASPEGYYEYHSSW